MDRADQGTALREYLAQAIPIIKTILGHGRRNVQTTLYEESEGLFTRMSEWVSQSDGVKADRDQIEEPLVELAGELFSYPVDATIETIRKGRAQAVVAYISVSQQGGLKVSEVVKESMKPWREGERSLAVQQRLEEARRKLGQ